jgi:hypothetical protein
VPVEALLIGDGKEGAVALLAGETGEKGGRRLGHPAGGGRFQLDRCVRRRRRGERL